MTTAPNSTATIDGFLAAVRGSHGSPDVWARDAILDAVVPAWRMAVRWRSSIERQLQAWFRDAGTLDEVRRHPIAGGEVVEFTVTWIEGDVPHAARQVQVLELDPDGLITRDAMWCGGRWSALLLADMAAASDAE